MCSKELTVNTNGTWLGITIAFMFNDIGKLSGKLDIVFFFYFEVLYLLEERR